MGGSGIYYLAKPTLHDHFKFQVFLYMIPRMKIKTHIFIRGRISTKFIVNPVISYSIVGFSLTTVFQGKLFLMNNSDQIFNAGVGIGIDLETDKGIIFNLHITYQYTTDLEIMNSID